VLGGAAADRFLVTAQAEDGPALFLARADGVDQLSYTIVDGSQAAELRFRDTPAERLGALDLEEAVSEARLIAAAELLGLSQKLFDETLGYVKQREQFGQPLGRFQVVQHRLVDCYANFEQMRSTLWRAVLDGNPHGRHARRAAAKAFIAERALRIGHEAIQLHGGMGVTDELVVGHAHKRVLLLSKLFGDPAADLALCAEAA
jgi:alkylation response protein AidB-like acyl-CoA dehydrogenase